MIYYKKLTNIYKDLIKLSSISQQEKKIFTIKNKSEEMTTIRGIRPSVYTEIEKYILNRCHVGIVQEVMKKCVFGATDRELDMLKRIYTRRMGYSGNREQYRIYRTILRYIKLYIRLMDFKTQREINVAKYGYEWESDRYCTERAKDDYTQNIEYEY